MKVNLQDASKRTPLYVAAVQGHVSAVTLLIDNGADPAIGAVEGDNILHVAAYSGNGVLLEAILKYPQVKKLVNSRDLDGKEPIHKAVWGNSKPHAVKLLLEQGANPNATNNFGYTPLHWAAKHGHSESSNLLREKNAKLDAVNQNDALPFDLAVSWNQDAFLLSHLGSTPRPQDEQPKTIDLEGYFSKQLLEAKKQNCIEEQILYLLKIGDIYQRRLNYPICAKIFNCALALTSKLAEKNPSVKEIETYLFHRLELVERLYLKSLGFALSTQPKPLTYYRKALQNIRTEAKEAQEKKAPIPQILAKMTQGFKGVLAELIAEGISVLGAPPEKWACIGMGSMSRGEMCPYSDIEFAFLIEKDSPKARDYFRLLSQFLEMRVINLGETKFPVFGSAFDSPTPDGFCMDAGGNTPLGVKGVYELIGTPKQMAGFQETRWLEDRGVILPNALSNVCQVAGAQNLVDAYNKEKSEVQNAKAAKDVTAKKNYEQLALRLLAGHLDEFRPDLSRSKEKVSAFGIKKELYRPFQEILGCLALYFRLTASDTYSRIDELVQKGIISAKAAENLKKAVNQVLSLRLEAHLFYKDEKEFLCHPEQAMLELKTKPLIVEGKIVGTIEEYATPKRDPSLLYMNDEHIRQLQEIYQILIPFHQCASEFFTTKSADSLKRSDYFDNSPSIRGKALEKAQKYDKAAEACQEEVSLNPNNYEAQMQLGLMAERQGNSREALQRFTKALELLKLKWSVSHPDTAAIYNNLGSSHSNLANYTKALEFFDKSLQIAIRDFGANHPNVAKCYLNMAMAHKQLGQFDQALQLLNQALQIQLHAYGTESVEVGQIHNNIGSVYQSLEKNQEALKCFQKAQKIWLRNLGDNHPDVGISYINIGLIHKNLGELDKAMECYQKGLKISLSAYGEKHPQVAACYNNLGTLYSVMENSPKALDAYNKAVAIQRGCYGKRHPAVSTSYNNIGLVYDDMKQYEKAVEFYEKALAILLAVLGLGHPNVGATYSNLGLACYNLGHHEKAMQHFLRAIEIQRKTLGEQNLPLAASYNHIAKLYKKCDDDQNALNYYQKALNIYRAILKNDVHPLVGENSLACAEICKRYGQYDGAHNFYQLALFGQNRRLGENHLENASLHVFMGVCLFSMEKPNEALAAYRKALQIRAAHLGEGHVSLAEIYMRMSVVYSTYKKYKDALDCSLKALEIQRKGKGEIHSDVALVLGNMGAIYVYLDQMDKVIESYQKAVDIMLLNKTDDLSKVAAHYESIGSAFSRQKNYQKALENYQKAFEILHKQNGDNLENFARICFYISTTLASLEKYDEALPYSQKALEIRIQHFGEKHVSVAEAHFKLSVSYYNNANFQEAMRSCQRAISIYDELLGPDNPESKQSEAFFTTIVDTMPR